ncbi:MAG: ATP-binding protein [Desulfovibrionales bacterium]|nr:ATP-binding protein [Desulfovibrionales bacterium]
MRKYLSIVVCAILLCLASYAVASPPHDDSKNVLVLNSYHSTYAWSEAVQSGIQERLEEGRYPLTIYHEDMDTKQFAPEEIFPYLYSLYQKKYGDITFDVIIASDNNALSFLLKYGDKLFSQTPIVFCGVSNFTPQVLGAKGNITGVVEQIDITKNLDLALTLFPNTKHVALVGDGQTVSSINNYTLVTKGIEAAGYPLDVITLYNLPPELLQRELQELPDDTIIFYLSYFRAVDGTRLRLPEALALISSNTDKPMFSLWCYALQGGVLGGYVVDGETQGAAAADIATRILEGTPVTELPVVTRQRSTYLFDYREMKRLHIAEPQLPPDAKIIYTPQTFFYKYKHLVIITMVSFIWMGIVIAGLLWLLKEKSKTARQLKKEEVRLESLLELTEQAEGSFEDFIQLGVEKTRALLNAEKCTQYFLNNDGTIHSYCESTEEETIYCFLPAKGSRYMLSDAWQHVATGNTTFRTVAHQNEHISEWPIGHGEYAYTMVHSSQKDGELRELLLIGSNSAAFTRVDERQFKLMMQRVETLLQRRGAKERERELSVQLENARRLEALGVVAGGIAHDFNNIIGAISSCCELALLDIPSDNPAREDIERVLKASGRGQDLVQKIKMFSRADTCGKGVINVSSLVLECVELLQRALPTETTVRLEDTTSRSAIIAVSASELHQVIMNLALNAEQAMEGAHRSIKLGVSCVSLPSQEIKTTQLLVEGDYVCITVTDNGKGISPEHLSEIFNPFYTTKKKIGGTGLGLSIVHGIAKKAGGSISVDSTMGKGTTFSVYFPLISGSGSVPPKQATVDWSGHESILVVDDNEEFLYSVSRYLTRRGYSVVSVHDGQEAYENILAHPDKYDLLLTDQIMPHMTGLELIEKVREILPDLPVVMYSGYQDNDMKLFDARAATLDIAQVVAKPFFNAKLSRVIRNILDEASARNAKERQHAAVPDSIAR